MFVSEITLTFASLNQIIVELKNNGMNNIESSTGEIVMYQPDETIRLEVRMGEETVWLTQQQMAELFDKDRTVISRHIRNIYKEEELEENITCAKFAHMGSEGDQTYEYTAYIKMQETPIAQLLNNIR